MHTLQVYQPSQQRQQQQDTYYITYNVVRFVRYKIQDTRCTQSLKKVHPFYLCDYALYSGIEKEICVILCCKL